MESKELITYKYQQGTYSVIHLIDLVRTKYITEQDFFDITRKHFPIMQEKKEGVRSNENN